MLVRGIAVVVVSFVTLALVRAPTPAAPAHSAASVRYLENPLPGHTGGFGEPTCRACHFSEPLNAEAGTLTLDGVPAEYVPGERYEITVRLKRPGLQRGGFQLAARFAEGPRKGTQAGHLRPSDTQRAAVTATDTVLYAHHTPAGTHPAATNRITWVLGWTAPDSAAASVAFHAAANAANDDASAFGDFIYTHEASSDEPH